MRMSLSVTFSPLLPLRGSQELVQEKQEEASGATLGLSSPRCSDFSYASN